MSAADWIALLGIALPLAAKVAVDVAAYLDARKHTALAKIVGMAGRLAASDARTLATMPPGTNPADLERMLVGNSTDLLLKEMQGSVVTAGGDQTKVAAIVQGELDKVLTAPTVAIAVIPKPVVAFPLIPPVPVT